MDQNLKRDILRFFAVYQSRTSDLIAPLSLGSKAEISEELNLLKVSILNRLDEDLGC